MATIYIVLIVIVILFLLLYYVPLGLWLTAKMQLVNISLLELIFMRLRKVPPPVIVHAMIEAKTANIVVNKDELEALFLSGGNVHNVIQGLIMAKENRFPLTYKEACAIDGKGLNVIEFVENELKRE